MDEKILINWSSYDVDNFGDLLFPFLVEYYLGNMYSKIIHASPTGTRSIWYDTKPTCTIADALRNKNIGGLVIGGGNLISWTASSSVNYVENHHLSKIVQPSFFMCLIFCAQNTGYHMLIIMLVLRNQFHLKNKVVSN